ncbi:MAG: endolytic transglycosylase MltG [Steroidobacterales bacterium]
MRPSRSIALVLLVAFAATAMLAVRALDAQMRRPSEADGAVRIEVLPKSSVRAILQRLQQLRALRSARLVELDLRLHGASPRMQVGTYDIPPHSSANMILEQFAAGRVVLEQLTVVEGWTFQQLRRALDEHPQLRHELRGLSDMQLMAVLGHPGEFPEGRFFPDTYRFAGGTSDKRILELAYERMQYELTSAWAARAGDLPLTDADQALVLASIVEKETGREDERSKVAAVFVNRLRRGMRLQADPTVIYGMGSAYDGDIRTRDLLADTPYNTYTRAGLPPTPIALPGAASIRAALHPAPIEALYFVATGDGDGAHHFSATLAEHDVALRHYLEKIGAHAAAR